MDNNNFSNLEKKINDFLHNFNQTADNSIDDEAEFLGIGSSRANLEEGLELTGRMQSMLVNLRERY